MQLQLYEDGSVGYLHYDGDEKANFKTGSSVVCTQCETEDRDEFISKNNIKLKTNMYGSNEQLDEKINDESYVVREAVASQGYGLDKLVSDENEYVRAVVVENGYNLDKFVDDKSWIVRRAVAWQGYGLDKLINDEDWQVRQTVAEQGYGLEKLINDEEFWIREAVRIYLKRCNLTLAEWKKQHNIENNIITSLLRDFIYKINNSNKLSVQTEYNSIDEFFNEIIYHIDNLDTLVVYTIDTKKPIIKIEKIYNNYEIEYKFIIDIKNEDGNDFISRTIIKSQNQLNKQIEYTIEALSAYPQFAKYIDDLKSCL